MGPIERDRNNTIFLVAFHKDPNNPKKLRPIGVPTAIRRITANILINKNKSDIAEYLLPFNYAIGVKGGINTITNAIRLGVEKYITKPQERGDLPTRALVSLDIKNMFNAVSRHKLREIIATEFPHLAPIANSLYKDTHQAMYKALDNNWQTIVVEEGFTQGCPFSPLFAGIVLTHILKKISVKLEKRANQRLTEGREMDDNKGGQALITAYVDDTNCLVPLEDVQFLLQQFEQIGVPLGAVMNTDKTRILTSTNSESIVPMLRQENPTLCNQIEEAIAQYSRKDDQPYEEVNGLRILGNPIGSQAFQTQFIRNYLSEAKKNASKVLEELDDQQTMLQLFRTCTTQQLTHLFTADVYAQEVIDPKRCKAKDWNLWNSEMTVEFDRMSHLFIKAITRTESLPDHSTMLMNLNTKQGGLGITTPRLKAPSAFVLNIKQSITSAKEGLNIGKKRAPFKLPYSISSLYDGWETSDAASFKIYRKFAPDIARVCGTDFNRDPQTFTYQTAVNKYHEKVNEEIKWRTKEQLIEWLPEDSKHNIEEVMDGKLGQGLLDLPRSEERNRQPNNLFRFNLLRCLRMDIWEGKSEVTCKLCQQKCDRKGDHLYQCAEISKKYKTTMHNRWRDAFQDCLDKICPLVELTNSKARIEQQGLVKAIEKTKLAPFDVMINIDRMTKDTFYNCKLQAIGYDITIAHTETNPAPSRKKKEAINIMETLRRKEKDKFQRGRGMSTAKTCIQDGITLSGEQITEQLYKTKQQLIPAAVTPLGKLGEIWEYNLYGQHPSKELKIDKEKFPYSYKMAKRATSLNTPAGILPRANEIWRTTHPNELYGGNYKCPDPQTYVEQQLGHTICFANGKYGLDAMAEMDGGPEPTNPDGSLYEFRNIAYLNATNTTETPASETLATILTPELSETSGDDEPQSNQTTPL